MNINKQVEELIQTDQQVKINKQVEELMQTDVE
jgi:hypothetical protein